MRFGKRGVKMYSSILPFGELEQLKHISTNTVILAIFLCSYILRIFAYIKLLNSYCGLIPIFGDIVCMRKIGLEFKNNYTSRYVVWGVISKLAVLSFTTTVRLLFIFLQMFMYMISSLFLLFSIPKEKNYWDFYNFSFEQLIFIIIVLSILIGVSIISVIVNINYRDKILRPLILLEADAKNAGMLTFLSSLSSMVFYIWVLSKKDLRKLDEIEV